MIRWRTRLFSPVRLDQLWLKCCFLECNPLTPLSLRISAKLAAKLENTELSSPTEITAAPSGSSGVSFNSCFSASTIMPPLFDYWFNHNQLAFFSLQSLEDFFWNLDNAFGVVFGFFYRFKFASGFFAI